MSPTDRREDLSAAIDFVLKNLRHWQLEETVQPFYEAWLNRLEDSDEACEHLKPPEPDEEPRGPAQEWRYRSFLDHELEKHISEGRLSEELCAHLLEENRLRGRKLRPLIHMTVPHAEIADESDETSSPNGETSTPSSTISVSSLLEAILDPRSLQYLMMLGGGLLVLGLVIWLATQGFFDNPVVVATLLAVGNLAVLGAGAFMLTRTRFQLAGRGLALLACMLMPFHLWFYDSQGLIVLDDGGHLWIPALVIALLYTACALLIRDTMFVYAVVGGVTLTGLMILGDQTIARFWEGAAATTLLIGIAAASIHAELAFSPGDGPFSRKEFGLAFYRAGHCVLAAGLVVMLNWTVCAWTYGYGLSDLWLDFTHTPIPFTEPALATSHSMKLLALGLTLTATYLYGYSYIVVRRQLVWVAAVTLTFLWSELIFVDLLPLPITANLVITMFAATAIVMNTLRWGISERPNRGADEDEGGAVAQDTSLLISLIGGLATLLVGVPLCVGITGYVRAMFDAFTVQELGEFYMLAMALTAVAGYLGAHTRRHEPGMGSTANWTMSGLAAVLLSFGVLSYNGLDSWDITIPVMLLLPLAIAAILTAWRPTFTVALATTAQVIVALLVPLAAYASIHGVGLRVAPATGVSSPLMFAAILLETAIFFVLLTIRTKSDVTIYMSALAASAALWQVMYFHEYTPNAYLLCYGGMGLVLLFIHRVLTTAAVKHSNVATAIDCVGHLMLSIAGVGCILMSLNRLWVDGFHGETVLLQTGFIGAALITSLMQPNADLRRWYHVLAIGEAAAMFLLVTFGLDLEPWQKTEIFATASGLIFLLAAHVGWAREQERPQEWVTVGLAIGSLLTVGPFVIGMLAQRFDFYTETTDWRFVHEIGALTVALILLGSGILCRLKSTTVVGGIATLTYVATLLVFIRLPHQLQHMAVYMMIGGGAFFVIALLLSIYRDYLLSLPERLRNRKGLFRVLTWR